MPIQWVRLHITAPFHFIPFQLNYFICHPHHVPVSAGAPSLSLSLCRCFRLIGSIINLSRSSCPPKIGRNSSPGSSRPKWTMNIEHAVDWDWRCQDVATTTAVVLREDWIWWWCQWHDSVRVPKLRFYLSRWVVQSQKINCRKVCSAGETLKSMSWI